MYCFWSGESHLGQAKGVVATEPGFMGGHEVVKVVYNPNVIGKDDLDRHAKSGSCSPIVKSNGYRTDRDPQYYLKQTDYRYLPLTALQKTKINSAIGHRDNPEQFLSPRQLKHLQAIRAKKTTARVLYTRPFATAWDEISAP